MHIDETAVATAHEAAHKAGAKSGATHVMLRTSFRVARSMNIRIEALGIATKVKSSASELVLW